MKPNVDRQYAKITRKQYVEYMAAFSEDYQVGYKEGVKDALKIYRWAMVIAGVVAFLFGCIMSS
jgi:hypothetical protein